MLSEPTAPALVQMESWSGFSPMGPCRTNATAAHPLHLPLATHYGVPVASFMLGVCAHRPENALRRHWRGGCSGNASTCGGDFGVRGLNTPGLECEPHPGPHTHRVYALILSELLLGEAKRMVVGGGKKAGGASSIPALPSKPPPLDAAVTPSVMPESALSDMAGCHAHHGVGNPLATLDFAEGSCGSPVRQSGWRCYEDRPGKRGWISEDGWSNTAVGLVAPSAVGEPLTFSVPLSSVKLTVAYLRVIGPTWAPPRCGSTTMPTMASCSTARGPRAPRGRTSPRCMTALCGSSCRAKQKEQHRVHVQRVSGRKLPAARGVC